MRVYIAGVYNSKDFDSQAPVTNQLEHTFEVTPRTTVAQLKQLLKERNSEIQTSSLLFQDKPLDDSKTLQDYEIEDDCKLVLSASNNVSSSSSGPGVAAAAKKKTKKRCSFKSCISAPLRGVGDCTLCQGNFCSRHRLLEQHNCEGIQSCKQQMHERNAIRLQQQQTVANKV